MASAALVAVTEQVPPASVTDSVVHATEQPVEAPALNVTAPAPLPPVELSVAVDPYEIVEGVTTAVSADCSAFVSVTVTADEAAIL